MAETSNARMARGRGRLPVERLPYPVDAALDALRRFRHTDLVGANAFVRVSFLLPGDVPFGRVLKGFGEDEAGEVYVLSGAGLSPTGTSGTVHRIAAP